MIVMRAGQQAPSFSAPDQDGNIRSLEDYKGRKVVLFFYPKAMTPGCTAEVCNLRDNYKELQEQGYELLGVSADSVERQTKFTEKHELPFPLLSDENKEILNAYGVWGVKKMYGREYMGIYRTTFIIDEEGKIEKIIGRVKTKDHAAQILE